MVKEVVKCVFIQTSKNENVGILEKFNLLEDICRDEEFTKIFMNFVVMFQS